MELTAAEMVKVAHLARLEWDPKRAATLGQSLNTILTYMEELNDLDTSNVPPTVHAVELTNVWREDVPQPSLDHEKALQNAPERDGRYFKVPKLM